MNRNNIFMWAYISFIFLAIILRLLFDYSLWSPLVMAITISSILFSIEDLYASLEKTQGDICEIKENFTLDAHGKVEKLLSFYENVSNGLMNMEEDKVNSIQETCEDSKGKLIELLQFISDIECETKTGRTLQKQYQSRANLLVFGGFLSLFCTLIFASLITIPTTAQDIFTVCSFGVILMSHQIGIDKQIKNTDYMMRCQKFQQDLKDIENDLPGAEKVYHELIKCIENCSSKSEEEHTHAD